MSGLVPKLRFKQDDGSDFPEWEEAEFDAVLKSIPTKNHQIYATDINQSGKYAVIDQGKKFIAGYSNDESKLITKSGVIIFGDHTTELKFVDFNFIVGADGVKVLHSEQCIKYLYYFLAHNRVEPEGYKRHFSILRQLIISLPSLPEQQKIADFLSSVDAKIDAVKRKLNALERYKKGLMQQIFAQKIRFKQDDGSDFPEWKEKRLGLLGKFTGGGTPDTNNTFYWNGHIPWISSSDILEGNINEPRITRFINEEALRDSATKIVPARSILIVTRVGVGKLAVSTHDICTSQDFTSFTPSRDNVFFLGFWMLSNKNALLKLCQGTSIKGLTSDDLKSLIVPIPSLPEQQRIADFLSAIDAKIDAIKTQVEKLEAFKQGLLQQMLV